jgi:glycosyltransferase involved in cell wall biosynthesis
MNGTNRGNVASGDAPVLLVGGGNIIAGKEIMLLALARGLREAGCKVEIITSTWGAEREFVTRLKSEGFSYRLLRLGFISMSLRLMPILWTLDQLRYWPSLVIEYRKAIAAAAPQAVIHTNWQHALLLLPFLDPARDIYWNHEIVPDNWRYRRVFHAIANRVAIIVCVSHAAARSLQALGIDPARIVVIHNSVPPPDAPLAAPEAKRPLRLGMVGQIGEWKGHGDVLQALASLTGGADDVVLKIFGTGDARYVDALKARAESLGLTRQIEWAGFVASQRDIYSRIDVCLMPSRAEESFGLAALEAGIYGRPVICTSLGALPEVVRDGETGFLVEAGRPDQLAAAISTFAQQPERISAMGAAARKRTGDAFAFTGFVGKFRLLVARRGSEN